jgi:hypothetical protein
VSRVVSNAMRDVLIKHLDGAAVPISAPSGSTWNRSAEHDRRRAIRFRTTRWLVELKMLRDDGHRPPRATTITDKGRAALAAALADWAEALVRAGYGFNDSLTMPAVVSAPCPSDPPIPSPAAAGPTADSSARTTPRSVSFVPHATK